MKKKVLIRGPVLTQSGYGEHCRFLLRALKEHQDTLDLYVHPTGWGKTGWQTKDSEETKWINGLIKKLSQVQNKISIKDFDYSIQVTIPNEWEPLCKKNIGVTAGIETNMISPAWADRSQLMDRIITISEHSKRSFVETKFQALDKKNNQLHTEFTIDTPMEIVHYPVKTLEKTNIELDLDYDFNFLTVAQWGPRKNLKNTIKWFMDEFKDTEVGLVVKSSLAKNCLLDRRVVANKIEGIVNKFPDAKCKVYLVHGYMSEEEMNGLYTHPKIKALISLTHGEGFGLPLFEAAYNGLPVVATNWSGHLDFLNMPVKDKKGKVKNKPMFSRVAYELKEIDKKAVWPGVLEKESKWAYAEKGSYKMRIRDVYKDYTRLLSQAKKLQKWIIKEFTNEKQNEIFVKALFGSELPSNNADTIFVSDFFADQLSGGAEYSLQALMDKCENDYVRVNSQDLTTEYIKKRKDKTWIFGNYTQANSDVIDELSNNGYKYHIVEFDYKYCRYRNLELHEALEGEKCNCIEGEHGKRIEAFMSNAKNVFFMSLKQMQVVQNDLKSLKKENCMVLSSVFDDAFFETIEEIRDDTNGKDGKWVISSSPSWMKGTKEAEEWCIKNEKEYKKLHGLPYEEALRVLAKSKGLCFLPTGADTCPRLVIEARLLGCELELNDNVQHIAEEWFNIDDLAVTENYLKGRPQAFWERVNID